jgi:hypothetical protein
LHKVEVFVHLNEFREETFSVTTLHNVGVGFGFLQDFSPGFVNTLEHTSNHDKLLHDIRGVKNGPEIGPVTLATYPFFTDILDHSQHDIPFINFFPEGGIELRELLSLSDHNMVVKEHISIIESTNSVGVRCFEIFAVEENLFPLGLHLG